MTLMTSVERGYNETTIGLYQMQVSFAISVKNFGSSYFNR